MPKKRVPNKIPKETEEVDSNRYECNICQDRKVVYKEDNSYRTCKCVIEKRVKEFLDLPYFNNVKVNKKLDVSKLDKNLLMYRGVKYANYISRVKSFLFKYFLQVDNQIDYVVMTGSDYIGYYVVGEHEWVTELDYLFLTLGKDNYNTAMQTVIATLINDRINRSKKTWVFLYDDVSKSKLVDLYGNDFYKQVVEGTDFSKVSK